MSTDVTRTVPLDVILMYSHTRFPSALVKTSCNSTENSTIFVMGVFVAVELLTASCLC